MTRVERDFFSRESAEQEWMLENTWCDTCRETDIGISSPLEYEEDGVIYIEGQCCRCGQTVRSSVHETGGS